MPLFMPITKDSCKYVAVLTDRTGATQLIGDSNDKDDLTLGAVERYAAEEEQATPYKEEIDYVEPMWDMYIRERDVAKLKSAVRELLSQVVDVDAEGQRAIDAVKEALDNL